MKAPRPFGNEPVMTIEQYKKILELKKIKRLADKSYTELAEEFGVNRSTVLNALHRGIKRYDYALWKEGKL